MTNDAMRVPVLIVGGGPAGLTIALLLARYGVASTLLEKHSAVSPLPRARGVHSRAMEILRGCGTEDDMRRHQLAITPGAEWRPDLVRPAVREVRTAGPDFVEVSPCEGLAIAQDVFETVLETRLREEPLARIRRGVELTAMTDHADGVTATILDRASGKTDTVDARYVVAADGARSAVRDLLGIPLEGAQNLGGQLSIAFRADLEPHTGRAPRGLYFLTDSGAALFSTHPDNRWALTVSEEDGPTDPVATVRRVTGLSDLPVEIIAVSRWTAAARSATRYATGRVFLIGDAAHQVPPAGATGVSTAMADAHNLAWKLAAVLQHRAGTALLDTYAAERQPVGQRNATEFGAAWIAITTGGQAPTGRSLRQTDMGFRYHSHTITPEHDQATQNTPITPTDPDNDDDDDYLPTGSPGCRAPHLWITDSDARSSIIDLFGPNLTLLSGPAGRPWHPATQSAAAALGIIVDTHQIDAPEWPQLYGVSPTGAVLIRPDGHITWLATHLPYDPMQLPRDLLLAAAARALDLPQ